MNQRPEPVKVTFSLIGESLAAGAAQFKRAPGLSIGYSALFTLIGFMMYMFLETEKLAPMSISLAGGFMLVGPALLAGFFSVSDTLDEGRSPTIGDIIAGFRKSPAGLWGIAFLCMFLFFIWITDAGTIYAFVVGQDPIGFLALLPPIDNVTTFLFFSSLMGLVLAFIIFAISAFSVPLLIYQGTPIVQAVVASIRAVFRNFVVAIAWALVLTLLVMTAALFLPLLPLTLPICAYASLYIYRGVFPQS